MNFFQFVVAWWTTNVELVRALAWPTVVIASVWVLREPLTKLIPSVEKIKVGGNEVIFHKAVEQLQGAADDANIPKVPTIQTTPTTERRRQTAETYFEINEPTELPEFDPADFLSKVNAPGESPAFSIYWSMQALQSDMNILLDYRPEHDPFFVIPPRMWADVLKKEGYISDKTEDLVQGLYTTHDFILDGGQRIRLEDAANFSNLIARARLAIRADYANFRARHKDAKTDSTDVRVDNSRSNTTDPKKD